MQQKIGKHRTRSSGNILAEREAEKYIEILITILARPLRGFARR